MRRSTIANAKNQLSRLLEAVRAGETVLILDRDRPVARLEPVHDADASELPPTLARLERAGGLRRATTPLPAWAVAAARGGVRRTPADVAVDALLEDRREGR